MAYGCKVLADSMSPDGVRLTTLEVTFPRIVLAEFNTHRMFSRNSASSRAIPVEKMIARVLDDPFIPVWWGKNEKGMQASEELEDRDIGRAVGGQGIEVHNPRRQAERLWLKARDNAVEVVRKLAFKPEKGGLDLHKQIANRLLEPWLWHTVIVTATEWDNFFALRCHKAAQPEMRRAAELMRVVLASSSPREVGRLGCDKWHLPLLDDEERHLLREAEVSSTVEYWIKVSVGRCTRVSYLTHEGKRDRDEDVALCERIRKAGHMSPFEHVARPMTRDGEWCETHGDPSQSFAGNFRGWVQYRKELPNEAIFHGES